MRVYTCGCLKPKHPGPALQIIRHCVRVYACGICRAVRTWHVAYVGLYACGMCTHVAYIGLPRTIHLIGIYGVYIGLARTVYIHHV